MRRHLIAALAATAALGFAACGGGGDSKDAASNAATDGAGALSKLAANSAAANVCGGREAVSIGAAFASAVSKTDVDYNDVASALEKAADAAPSEIKDDFHVIAEAEGPFLQVLAKTDFSDYMALASNTEYQQAVAKLGTDAFKKASANVNNWFEEHCK